MKDKLTILVGTCDAYSSIWENFNILFKRYWNIDCEIIIVGETIPMKGDNYINVLPGLGLSWGQRILAGIDQIKTEYVCFILDDYYMTTKIDNSFMQTHIDIMNQYSAEKIMFEIVDDWVEYKLTHMKDSLYKLMVGSDLRNFGVVKLEEIYKKIEAIVGEGKIDPEILKNAWNVIKAYANNQVGQVKGGTGFK